MVLSASKLIKKTASIATAISMVLGAQALADIIMSPAGLNTTLKTMARLKQQIESASQETRNEALFQLGMESDALASLMNDEVASHGMQQKQLLDLALERTKHLGISITYNREKRKFFYDGLAFELYVKRAPRGKRIAAAKFKLLEKQFYQSRGKNITSLRAAARANEKFLNEYPRFSKNAEVSLFLAIDYRDLYRLYRDKKDPIDRKKYETLTRRQLESIPRQYPGTEQAQISEQLLRRFSKEVEPQTK